MKLSVFILKKKQLPLQFFITNYEIIVSGAASGTKQLRIIESIDMLPY